MGEYPPAGYYTVLKSLPDCSEYVLDVHSDDSASEPYLETECVDSTNNNDSAEFGEMDKLYDKLSRHIMICNYPKSRTLVEIMKECREFGTVMQIEKNRTNIVVSFDYESEAKLAVESFNLMVVDGRKLVACYVPACYVYTNEDFKQL